MHIFCQQDKSPESESALELHNRAVPSVEAHHRVQGPDTSGNSGERRLIKKSSMIEQVAKNRTAKIYR